MHAGTASPHRLARMFGERARANGVFGGWSVGTSSIRARRFRGAVPAFHIKYI